jgi:predicted nucleotidyltransferase
MFEEIIEQYISQITEKFDIKGIILFGSVARGTAKKRLEESLTRLHAVKISHGWFIPRNSLDEVISFH